MASGVGQIQDISRNRIVVKTTDLAPPSDEGFTRLIHVLHVDDDTSILEVSKQILIDMGNFEIDHACCVDEAFKKLSTKQYDVVISDYEMPQKDGLQFLKDLREQNNEVPFILFTGKGREEVAIKALNLGADAYINKQGNPETVYGELSHSVVKTLESKNSKKLLAESESKYFHLFNTSEVGMFRTMLHSSEILDINEKLLQILGYNREEMQGKLSTVCYADAAQRQELVKILEAKGQVVDFEIRLISKQGEIKTCLLSSKLYPEKEMVEGSIIDVTERKKAEQALAESEEKYKNLFENAPDVIVTIDLNGKITSVNKAITQHGFEENEIVGESIFKLVPIEYNQKMLAGLRNIATGKPAHGEIEILTPNGRRNTEYNSNPIWKSGKVIGYQTVIRDITERKHLNLQLVDSEQRYHALFDEAPLGVLVIEPQTGKPVEFNNVAHTQLGYCREEFSKLCVLDFEAKERADETRAHLARMMRQGGDEFETKHRTKSGEIRDVLVTARAVELVGKTFLYCIFHDITEIRQVQDELMRSETQYRQLVNVAQEGIWVFDREYRTVFVNPRMANMLGYAESDMVGKNLFDFIAEAEVEQAIQFLAQHKRGVEGTFEYEFPCKDGSKVYASVTASLIKDDEGNPAGTLALVSDITLRKKTENELKQESQKLETITESIGVGLTITSKDYRIIWANKVMKKVRGISDLEGRTCYATYNYLDAVCPDCGVKKVFEGKEFDSREYVVFDKEKGSTIWMQLIATPIKDKDGNVTSALELVLPITERKMMEQSLKVSEERFRTIMNSALDAIIAIDGTMNIVEWNPAASRIFGYTQEEIIGKPISKLIPFNIAQTAIQEIRTFVETNHARVDWKSHRNNWLKEGWSRIFC